MIAVVVAFVLCVLGAELAGDGHLMLFAILRRRLLSNIPVQIGEAGLRLQRLFIVYK